MKRTAYVLNENCKKMAFYLSMYDVLKIFHGWNLLPSFRLLKRLTLNVNVGGRILIGSTGYRCLRPTIGEVSLATILKMYALPT